ncbi:S-layer homology domain-containing protein [Paenibacillus sp. SGZ-1009]|uniref:S-layer homology domain-containing protein n=1 Tax=Paenibacillus campi TaxID=3106031 RepID=UPI002AFF5E95|nr:S-layer homology domain-containing protein [Paenibacillus sp. SGZ-1009]
MWNTKQKVAATLALSCAIAGGATAAAAVFTDVKGADNQAIVSSLQDKGIINGITATQFKPNGTLTQAQAIQMLAKAFELKKDGAQVLSGVNQPWYSAAVAAAKANKLSLPASFQPSAAVNREDFALWLYEAINTTGQYPATKMFVVFQDQDQIDKQASNAIQTLVNMNVIPRSSVGQKFEPKTEITRMDAAVWVNSAVQMIERAHGNEKGDTTTPPTNGSEGSQLGYDPQLNVTSTSDGKQKVTLTVQMPNPGYGLKINDVKLTDDKRAIITYSLTQPQPGMMYPQVISEGKAETVIPAGYTAELAGK